MKIIDWTDASVQKIYLKLNFWEIEKTVCRYWYLHSTLNLDIQIVSDFIYHQFKVTVVTVLYM